jgi:hypothetical protein
MHSSHTRDRSRLIQSTYVATAGPSNVEIKLAVDYTCPAVCLVRSFTRAMLPQQASCTRTMHVAVAAERASLLYGNVCILVQPKRSRGQSDAAHRVRRSSRRGDRRRAHSRGLSRFPLRQPAWYILVITSLILPSTLGAVCDRSGPLSPPSTITLCVLQQGPADLLRPQIDGIKEVVANHGHDCRDLARREAYIRRRRTEGQHVVQRRCPRVPHRHHPAESWRQQFVSGMPVMRLHTKSTSGGAWPP